MPQLSTRDQADLTHSVRRLGSNCHYLITERASHTNALCTVMTVVIKLAV